ncbi:MAG: hypothetical protein ACTSVL_08730 [Promethearchaeota archaeon]
MRIINEKIPRFYLDLLFDIISKRDLILKFIQQLIENKTPLTDSEKNFLTSEIGYRERQLIEENLPLDNSIIQKMFDKWKIPLGDDLFIFL